MNNWNVESIKRGSPSAFYPCPVSGTGIDLVAVRGEMVVQFWRKPGDVAMMLGVGEERRGERISEQLGIFL